MCEFLPIPITKKEREHISYLISEKREKWREYLIYEHYQIPNRLLLNNKENNMCKTGVTSGMVTHEELKEDMRKGIKSGTEKDRYGFKCGKCGCDIQADRPITECPLCND